MARRPRYPPSTPADRGTGPGERAPAAGSGHDVTVIVHDAVARGGVGATEATGEGDCEQPAPAAVGRPPLGRRHRRWLVAIVAAGLLLRLAWGLYALDEVPKTWLGPGDQYSYWYYGNEIADGNGYISYITHEATAYYPIGYPATLAALFWLQDHTPLPDHQPTAVAVFHALVSAGTVLLVFVVARALLSPRRALVAAGITAVMPNLVLYVASYTLEPTFMFLLMAALAVFVTHDWAAGPPGVRRVAAFGGVLALSAVVRPFSLPLLLALGAGVVVSRGDWRRAAGSVALAALPAALLMTAWGLRNLSTMDAFVPISTNLGDTACLDRSLDSDGGFAWSVHEGCVDPFTPDGRLMPETERSERNLAKAASFVVEHPMEEMRLVGLRLANMFEHGHSGIDETENVHGQFLGHRTRLAVTWAADLYFWILSILALVGVATVLARRGDAATRVPRWTVAFTLAVLLAIPLGLWGNPRFHVPLLSLMAVSAAAVPLPARLTRAGRQLM